MKRAILFSLVMCLIAVPAAADTGLVRDKRDTEGPFDIRAAIHEHSGNLLTHTIRTHGKWKWRDARCFKDTSKCRAFFRFYFSRRQTSGGYHRYVDVFRRGGRTFATMYRFAPDCFSTLGVCSGASPRKVGEPDVHRPGPRSLKVSFPEGWLGKRVHDHYFWRANVVFWREKECPQDSHPWSTVRGGYLCLDYARDIGRLPQRARI